jgi:predicted adenine nucleotide alpha hydrolase (AANH) superfamily ATPase
MVEIARREGLYQQDYCGCPSSRRRDRSGPAGPDQPRTDQD